MKQTKLQSVSQNEIFASLKGIPCLLHGKVEQIIKRYNESTGNFAVQCPKCKKEGISNVITGSVKKK